MTSNHWSNLYLKYNENLLDGKWCTERGIEVTLWPKRWGKSKIQVVTIDWLDCRQKWKKSSWIHGHQNEKSFKQHTYKFPIISRNVCVQYCRGMRWPCPQEQIYLMFTSVVICMWRCLSGLLILLLFVCSYFDFLLLLVRVPPPHSSLLRCNITKENERTIMFIHNIQFWMFRSAHHRQHNSVDMKWPNKMALCVKKAFTSRRNRNSQRFNGARSFSLFFSDAMTLNFTLIDVQLAHTHTEFF